MSINFSSYAVCDNGSVDVEATLDKFRSELVAFAEQEQAVTDRIATAVNAVFEKHGDRLTKEYIMSLASQEMSLSPDDWRVFKTKMSAYLSNKSKFVAAKGKNGGLSRV